MTGNLAATQTRPLAQRVRCAVLVAAINLVLTLALIEIALRAQQVLGPLYDLDINPDPSGFGLSDEFNHTFLASETEWDADGTLAEDFRQGLLAASKKPFYLRRLLAKLYFTRVVYPRLSAEYRSTMEPDGYWISKLPAAEARQKYGAVIEYYARTLEDLTHTAVGLLGSSQRLIYIYHPLLYNFRTQGVAFNSVTSDTIREVAARNNVRYYDATDDLRTEFGKPERYYIPNDMHFNERGLKAYGDVVAKYLATAIPGDLGSRLIMRMAMGASG